MVFFLIKHFAGTAQDIIGKNFAAENIDQALIPFFLDDADLIVEILFHLVDLFFFDLLGAFVFGNALAGENLHIDDSSFDAGRSHQRSIPNLSGLFAEDRAEQFFFRRKLCFSFGSHFPDQHIARTHLGADPDDAALIEIPQAGIADIRDIPRDFFRPKLGIPRFDFQLFDMNGGVAVFFDQLFADQDRVLKVVAAPGHEGDQHVAAQGEFALVRARPIRQHLALDDVVAPLDERRLVDAGILIRALEFGQRVNIDARIPGGGFPVFAVALNANDDARCIHAVDDAGALADHHSAGILGGKIFHAGPDIRRFGPEQRNCLALHVRSHESAVGVVVFEEWNQARGNADELFGRNVDVLNVFARHEHEIAGLARIDALLQHFAMLVQFHVGLGDRVFFRFPCRLIERERLILGGTLSGSFTSAVFLIDRLLFDLLADFEMRIARDRRYAQIPEPCRFSLCDRAIR